MHIENGGGKAVGKTAGHCTVKAMNYTGDNYAVEGQGLGYNSMEVYTTMGLEE